jgi:hypothetical protein
VAFVGNVGVTASLPSSAFVRFGGEEEGSGCGLVVEFESNNSLLCLSAHVEPTGIVGMSEMWPCHCPNSWSKRVSGK